MHLSAINGDISNIIYKLSFKLLIIYVFIFCSLATLARLAFSLPKLLAHEPHLQQQIRLKIQIPKCNHMLSYSEILALHAVSLHLKMCV